VACCYADVQAARAELHWQATRSLDDMCASAWRFQSRILQEAR
jgi:UDP-glucose 4-epimerase